MLWSDHLSAEQHALASQAKKETSTADLHCMLAMFATTANKGRPPVSSDMLWGVHLFSLSVLAVKGSALATGKDAVDDEPKDLAGSNGDEQ